MGNSFKCFYPPTENTTKSSSSSSSSHPGISVSPSNQNSRKAQSPSSTPKRADIFDESFIKQQAQIASMLYHQHLQQNNSDILHPLDRSVSTKNYPKPKNFAKKSYSVSSSNPLSLQLSKQDFVRNKVSEGNDHFVLVHGGGFGAWCWYKIIALLKESNCEVDAIDLTGSGLNSKDINYISTIEEYCRPLTEFLKNLPDNQKVILVGHDLGGACVSYAMELYPSKVSKAIFVAATMLTHGQSALDVFSQQSNLSNLNQRAQKFIYANGKSSTPTAIDFDKSLIDEILFNRTPTKDMALASVSMRLIPFAPVAEKLSLSTSKYGSIPRFYVKTDVQDLAIPVSLQEAMITSDPPKQVFDIKGSDHSPFFSKPQALHRVLMQISRLSLDSILI